MNVVIISGNLGANPEVRQTASGLAVANLSVATNERVKQDGEWADHTEWHRITDSVEFMSQAQTSSPPAPMPAPAVTGTSAFTEDEIPF